jgi:hypothetical protein
MTTSIPETGTAKKSASTTTKKPPAAKKPITARAAIAKVLADGKAQPTKQITAAAAKLATGLKGKTPEQSLAALLYVEAKKENGLVIRGAEKGMFQLRPVAAEA